ncbi:MAG: hypothetical protein ACI835_003554, partial [Planctomycetota bacterium]
YFKSSWGAPVFGAPRLSSFNEFITRRSLGSA